MRRSETSRAVFRRLLVALVCASALLFNMFALGHARGVVATKHVQTAMLAAEAGRPCPLTTMGASVCPFSVFATSNVLAENALHPPGRAQAIFLAHSNEAVPSPRNDGTPFRPPRTV